MQARPFVPNLNVADVPGAGIAITIISVGETSAETKAKIENARDCTIEFSSSQLDKAKFPEGKAKRMFASESEMAKQLALLAGGSVGSNGSYDYDEKKLIGKKCTLYRIKSGGKFTEQDTLSVKK